MHKHCKKQCTGGEGKLNNPEIVFAWDDL
jgi:hypothetical protein